MPKWKELADSIAAHANMVTRADLPRRLTGVDPATGQEIGKRKAMHNAGKTYLPLKTNEKEETWQRRRDSSHVENFFERSVDRLANKPFASPIVRKGFTEEVDEWLDDIDAQGRSIDVFARDVLVELLSVGCGSIVPEHTQTAGERVLTKEERRVKGFRPYLAFYPMEDVPKWFTVGDSSELGRIHLKESSTKQGEDLKEESVERCRVLRLPEEGEGEFVIWELYEKGGDDGEAEFIKEGTREPFASIPHVRVQLDRSRFMVGYSPLEAVADLNLAHYQSASMQRYNLDFARFPMLFLKNLGLEEEELEEGSKKDEVSIGPDQAIIGDGQNADAKVVESTGSGISAGERDLEILERRAKEEGREPLVNKVQVTATSEVKSDIRESADLKVWACQALCDDLNEAVRLMAESEGIDIGDARLEISADFSLELTRDFDKEQLNYGHASGVISDRKWLSENERRGLFADDMSADEILEEARNQAPVIGTEEIEIDDEEAEAA